MMIPCCVCVLAQAWGVFTAAPSALVCLALTVCYCGVVSVAASHTGEAGATLPISHSASPLVAGNTVYFTATVPLERYKQANAFAFQDHVAVLSVTRGEHAVDTSAWSVAHDNQRAHYHPYDTLTLAASPEMLAYFRRESPFRVLTCQAPPHLPRHSRRLFEVTIAKGSSFCSERLDSTRFSSQLRAAVLGLRSLHVPGPSCLHAAYSLQAGDVLVLEADADLADEHCQSLDISGLRVIPDSKPPITLKPLHQ